jgi:cholesterol transport system auxiliary component
MLFITRILCLLMSLILTGCSMLSPVQVGPSHTYIVNSLPTTLKKSSHPVGAVLVALPETVPAYNTPEMSYIIQPFQVSYFAKNSWVTTPAQMLQPLIVETLQNTHHFQLVSTSPAAGRFDYMVNIQLLQFTQDFTQTPSMFRLKWRVQLIKVAGNRVVVSKDIAVIEPTFQDTPYGGVVAANKATNKALAILAQICSRHF